MKNYLKKTCCKIFFIFCCVICLILFHGSTLNYLPKSKVFSLKLPLIIRKKVIATAYRGVPSRTDDTPSMCAWTDEIHPNIIAISRDLEQDYALGRNKLVYVEVNEGERLGFREILDRMHKRKRNQIDIYIEDEKEARSFGRKVAYMYYTTLLNLIVYQEESSTRVIAVELDRDRAVEARALASIKKRAGVKRVPIGYGAEMLL